MLEPTNEEQARGGLSVDQLPIVGLFLLLLLNWVGADYYVRHTTFTEATPFVPVWSAYSRDGAAHLVPWALGGLAIALVFPLSGRMPLNQLTLRVREPVARLFPLWVSVAIAGIAVNLAAKGSYLWWAPEYLSWAMPQSVASLANVLLPVTLLASGVVSTRRPVFGTLLMVMTGTIMFGSATRVFAGTLALFVLGRFLGGARIGALSWLGAAVFGLLALPIPLFSRGLAAHGILPYSAALTEMISQSNYLSSSLLAAAENTGFTIPLLLYTAKVPGITVSDMMISLNPMPGDAAGWDRIMESMRVHEYIPYSMLGEFASFGPPALLLCTFLWGLVIRIALNSAARTVPLLLLPFLVGQLGLSLLTMVQITQYNTRAVARVLSIIVLLALLERVIRPACRPEFWRVPGGWRTLLSREGSP